MPTVEVRHKIIGAPHEQSQLAPLALDVVQERLPVRDLIAATVEEQVRDLTQNRRLDATRACRALSRQYLSDDPTTRAAQSAIDAREEARKAIAAFESGTYLIYVDGAAAFTPEEVVTLRPDSKVTFLRLQPLVDC